jgi:hypothetical protein
VAIATLCLYSVGLKERKEGSNVCTSRNGIKMGHEEEQGEVNSKAGHKNVNSLTVTVDS